MKLKESWVGVGRGKAEGWWREKGVWMEMHIRWTYLDEYIPSTYLVGRLDGWLAPQDQNSPARLMAPEQRGAHATSAMGACAS